MNATAAAIALLAGALLLAHGAHFDHIADDAYISLRYLAHALAGEGLVFNPGERVLGASNLLWIGLLAPLVALGLPAPAAAQGLGITLSVACIALVANEAIRRHRTPAPAIAASAWLAASGPFALWSQAGLEGPLFALALGAIAIACVRIAGSPSSRRSVALAAAVAAAAWTRPEGAAYGLAAALWLAWSGRRREAGLATASAVLAAASYVAFSLAYYGDLLPNTYYAKQQPLTLALLERGARFHWAYLKGQYGASALVLALFAATAGRRRAAPGWLAVGLIGAFALFYLRIGGDALVYHRMWAYVQPLLALVLADAVADLGRRLGNATLPRRVAVTTACAIPLLALPHSLTGFELRYLRADDQRIRSLAALGRELARAAPTETLVATNVIGALGYYSELPVVDMLGLTDRHIARHGQRGLGIPGHERHDGGYVLDRRPDLLLVGIPRASARRIPVAEAFRPAFPSDRDLAADPRLLRDYDYGHWTLRDGRHVALFARRGYEAPPALVRAPREELEQRSSSAPQSGGK